MCFLLHQIAEGEPVEFSTCEPPKHELDDILNDDQECTPSEAHPRGQGTGITDSHRVEHDSHREAGGRDHHAKTVLTLRVESSQLDMRKKIELDMFIDQADGRLSPNGHHCIPYGKSAECLGKAESGESLADNISRSTISLVDDYESEFDSDTEDDLADDQVVGMNQFQKENREDCPSDGNTVVCVASSAAVPGSGISQSLSDEYVIVDIISDAESDYITSASEDEIPKTIVNKVNVKVSMSQKNEYEDTLNENRSATPRPSGSECISDAVCPIIAKNQSGQLEIVGETMKTIDTNNSHLAENVSENESRSVEVVASVGQCSIDGCFIRVRPKTSESHYCSKKQSKSI